MIIFHLCRIFQNEISFALNVHAQTSLYISAINWMRGSVRKGLLSHCTGCAYKSDHHGWNKSCDDPSLSWSTRTYCASDANTNPLRRFRVRQELACLCKWLGGEKNATSGTFPGLSFRVMLLRCTPRRGLIIQLLLYHLKQHQSVFVARRKKGGLSSL